METTAIAGIPMKVIGFDASCKPLINVTGQTSKGKKLLEDEPHAKRDVLVVNTIYGTVAVKAMKSEAYTMETLENKLPANKRREVLAFFLCRRDNRDAFL